MAAPKTTKAKAPKKTVTKKTSAKKTAPKAATQAVPPSSGGPLAMVKEFLDMEASSGIILMFFAILAMALANSPFADIYHHVLHDTKVNISVGPLGLEKDLIHFINDGLMAIFFFLVGLEIKREMLEGNLSTFGQAVMPAMAAVGGMAVPGLVFFFINNGDPTAMKGWAIPTATDIAFALGVLALLGNRVPLSLKVFLLALAIFDDLGAILIIAFFYSGQLDMFSLILAAGFILCLLELNYMNVNKGTLYLIFGVALWFCVLKSGVHATLAGVILALTIPLKVKGERRSLLRQLEHDLHSTVAYFILPLFAFANAGVHLGADASLSILAEPVTLGVILGLLVGKQVGIFGTTWLAVKMGLAKLPKGSNWAQIWAVSCLAGIGFTMSLFIGTLAYSGEDPLLLTEAKLGILVGSIISGTLGFLLMYFFSGKKAASQTL